MRRAVWASLLVAVAGVSLASPASAGAGVTNPPRLLVLALPTLSWDDLHAGDTPVLDALLDDSVVASMSVRVIDPLTDAADGYTTISAGTRARGVVSSGQVLELDEDFFGVSAGSVFRRRTAADPGTGMVSLASPAIVSRNQELPYDAEIGALGQSLADANVPRAVIANADGRYVLGAPSFERVAGSSLADPRGLVPAGAVSTALLAEDPLAPFGVAYDLEAVRSSFADVWAAGGVVLVEGSDLARADRYRPLATSQQQERHRRDALRRTDALVSALLERVDLERDAVLVVAPYHSLDLAQLTVVGLHEPGVAPGLLRSASTRRAGFVTLVDVAPTILGLVGVDRPASMEGRAFERAEGSEGSALGRVQAMVEDDQAARFRDRMVAPVALVFVVLQAALWAGAALALSRGGPRSRILVSTAALVMLMYLPVSYLAGLVDFHDRGGGTYWVFLFGLAAIGGGLAAATGRRRPLDPLIVALAAVFGLLAFDMIAGAPLQLNTVFGYSPTVGGRFAGMGNLAYGQFAGAAFLLYGLASRRLADRRHATAWAFLVLFVAVVIDGAPMWGSDVGGVLAFVPAIGVTVTRALGARVRWRSVVTWAVGTALVVSAFAALDLARPEQQRTHLGRLVESVTDRGLGSLVTVMTRKLGANLTVITSSVWTAMVPVALGFIVFLLWRAPGRVRAVRTTVAESLGGLAVVGFLGFALNDSGIAVPGVMLGVVNASLVYLTLRVVPSLDPMPATEVAT